METSGGNIPRKYTIRSKEEKLTIVKQVLQGASLRNWESQGIRYRQVQDWVRAYSEEGEAGLEQKKKPGNPHDSAAMESFWGRFKDTLRKHFRYWEHENLRSVIEEEIYYFNNERRFVSLMENHQSCSERDWWHRIFCVY